MHTSITFCIGLLVAFTAGIFFPRVIRFMMRGADAKDEKSPRSTDSFEQVSRWKLAFALLVLFCISWGSWFAKYYFEQAGLNRLLSEIAAAVFGVSTAGLLGGVVFELLLRRQILREMSETLARVVMTRKEIIQGLFSRRKRNEIVRKILQIQLGSDVYGDALYSMVADFLGTTQDNLEFRFDFEDDITFEEIVDSEMVDKLEQPYYKVTDAIYFRTRLTSSGQFIMGCAGNEEQLYSLFSDPRCVYRWLLKEAEDVDFKRCIESGYGFNPSISIHGVACDIISSGFTEGGYEVAFANPFAQTADDEMRSRIGEVVEFNLQIETLHPQDEHILSVHLAYPVRGARMQFFFGATEIEDATVLHFFSSKYHMPRIIQSIGADGRVHRVTVIVRNDKWLWPDSGVVFVW